MAVAEPRLSAPFGAQLARDMAWNLQPLRFMRAAMARLPEAAPPPLVLSWSARRQLLAIFRRHAAVLQLTVELARAACRLEQHATLGARLAVLRARVEAGESSRSLLSALTEFGIEFDGFISWELGYRSA
jgi:hypothetical protein